MATRKDFSRIALTIMFSVLIASCGGGGSHSSPPAPPVANAGTAQTVAKRSAVTLDGSASHASGSDALTYVWSQVAGTPVTLSSTTAAKATFTAPGSSGVLSFSLTVKDGQVSSSAATVSITVKNSPPTASAGSAATVAANAPVALDGAGSSDPDGDPLIYKWSQISGTPVTLNTSSSAHPTFVAPNSAAVLEFALIVNDGEVDSAPATVTITVTAPTLAPIAMAGMPVTTPKRALVTLQGSGSDPAGKALTYHWVQTSGTSVTLQNANTATVEFTAPAVVGDLQFALTVNNGISNSLPSSVTVHVQNFAPVITSISLSPAAPARNTQIAVSVTDSDADGDPLTLSYVWTRNGAVVAGATGATYPLGNQAKNDVIAVTITVSDGTATGIAHAQVTIVDTPATLSGTAPTSVPYGQPVSFQVTAADIDGDPTGPIEVAYGPAGFSVSAAGLVTWTPSGPLFEQATSMAWQVRLHNSPQITLGGTISVTDAARAYPLVRTTSGVPVGNNAIDVEDFQGNGKQEVLIGTEIGLYILAKHGPADYIQTWAYPYDPVADGNFISAPNTGFNAVTSGDVNGDGHREIFFSRGPVIVELDGVTRREVARYGNQGIGVLGPYCLALKYADIDGDGKGELVCLGNNSYKGPTQLYVLDAKTLTLKWQSGILKGGTSMAIGNVEGSSNSLQIVTSDGFVFDGATHQNLWAYGPGFGSIIDVGDVNGDGIAKIIGTTTYLSSAAIVFSATLKSPIWQITMNFAAGASAIKVANLDGVGPDEILLGDAEEGNGSIYRYDATAKVANLVSQTSAIGAGVSAIGVGDVDGDGVQEVIWGSGSDGSAPVTLAIASWTAPPVVKWKGPNGAVLDGPFVGAKNALVATGVNRTMFATPSTNNGYSGERIIAMDSVTGSLQLSKEIDTNSARDRAFDVGNVLGTGIDSMLIGTATYYTPYFTAYDFASNTKSWVSGTITGLSTAVTHANLNGSATDIVGITSEGYIYAWDVLNQAQLWSSTQLARGVDVAAVDLDGDGVPEIIALTQTGVVVYKYSAANQTYLQTYNYAVSASNILVADTDGDGIPEIFVLDGIGGSNPGSGAIIQLSPSLTVMNQCTVPNASSFYLEDSAFSRKNLVVAEFVPGLQPAQASKITVVDPTTCTLIWQSPNLAGSLPTHSLSFHDWSGTGQLQMAFGTAAGMYVTR